MKYVNIWAEQVGLDTPIDSCHDPEDAWMFVENHISSSSVTDKVKTLQVEDCAGDTFSIREGKTSAAIREVPIHSALKTLIDDLIDNRKVGPLTIGLVPNGHDNRPSWHIGKTFGRIKKRFGFPPELVFHNLRHTFITALERAEVNVILIERIVGHKINNLTFGTYSKGQTLEAMREVVEEVSYEL